MKSTQIREIRAREVLDCKGKPAVEVDVFTYGGAFGRASSPSGVSAGAHEAFVLRDGAPDWYRGLGVGKAVENVKTVIAPALLGTDVFEQETIDERLIALDGTENKAKLGGNTIYSVSLACIKAAADTLKIPLYQYMAPGGIHTIPLPTFNCIDGGSYQKGTMPFQECTVVPYKAASIREAVHIGWRIFNCVSEVIREYQNGRPAKAGAVSGWQPPASDPAVCFDLLFEAAKRCGAEDKIAFAADCASSEFYLPQRGTYDFLDKEVDLDELLEKLLALTDKYPFLYMEDVVEENDWDGWVKASRLLTKTILIGDDFTVTNRNFLEKAYERKACGGFIFKPNQVGTVTECLKAYRFAADHDMLMIPSIRAGGTIEDNVIDMAVALGAAATKQGPPKNGERIYGLNFLLRAEDENPQAVPYDFSPHIRFQSPEPRSIE